MLDAQIQAYLRVLAGRRREVTQAGPFLTAFDGHSDSLYRNYAIPDEGARPTPEEVRALIAAFTDRERTPRLEYLPTVAPAVEGALLIEGFTVEERLPVMTIAEDGPRELPQPAGIVFGPPDSPAELLATATAQNIAYGGEAATEHDTARLRATIEAGGLVIRALDRAIGAVVGAGLYTAPIAGVTEIAAIGVLPAHRRRGIGGMLCVHLAREALVAGIALPFLMAAGEAEERMYARAGFATISRVLFISRPGPARA
jgi:GNAT superfamily N-acetyltransferase